MQQHQLQQLQLQPPARMTATISSAQQSLQTLLLQVPASAAASCSSTSTSTTSASQQREQQQHQQRQQSHQYRRYHHHHQQQQQQQQQQHNQRGKQMLPHHQQHQQQHHRRQRQFRPQRPLPVPVVNPAPTLRKFKPKLYLPLDITVPPLPPLPTIPSIPTLPPVGPGSIAPPPAAELLPGISGVAGMESLSLSLPLDFSQSCSSSGHVQHQQAGGLATSTTTSNPPGSVVSATPSASVSASASASASVSTAPLLMPVTLQSAAQQLRFFRRYSYNVIVSCIRSVNESNPLPQSCTQRSSTCYPEFEIMQNHQCPSGFSLAFAGFWNATIYNTNTAIDLWLTGIKWTYCSVHDRFN